jgi:hypothetical protein
LSSHGIQPNRVYAELQSIYAVLQSIEAGLVAVQPVVQPVEIVERRNCESCPDRCLDPRLQAMQQGSQKRPQGAKGAAACLAVPRQNVLHWQKDPRISFLMSGRS